MRFSLRSLLVLTALLSVALVCAPIVYRSALWYVGVPLKGHGVSAMEANRWLPPEYRLPKEATDVYYYLDAKVIVLEFAVSEPDFLDWRAEMGWRTFPLEPRGLYLACQHLSQHEFLLQTGHTIRVPAGSGFYDAEVSRVTIDVRWSR